MGVFSAFISRLLSRSPRDPQPNQVLSRFIAPDVRRDIHVIATDRVREGVITARVRTTNVLYVARGLMPAPEFEPPREMRLDEMWQWSGQPWGGLPDGSSVLGMFQQRAKAARKNEAGD